MIFAVATHSFLVIIDLDTDWQIQSYKLLNTGYHYGMAMVERGIGNSVAQQNSAQIVIYRGGESVSQQNDPQLVIFEAGNSFDRIGSIPLGGNIGDVHQLAYANGGIYITNTKYNSLIFQSLETDKRHEYSFESVSQDRNHVNSVYPCGDQIVVMLHNLARQESELAILRHHLAKGFTLEQRLSLWNLACHNVFFDNDHLLYNASQALSLVAVDIKKDRVIKRLSFEGHSKGMSVTQDYVVIGLSEHTFRDKRSTSKGHLVVIDRRSLSPMATIDLNFPLLPHPIGNINEIRCLSGGELAHGRSTPLNSHWSSLRLAKRNAFYHHLYQLQTKFLLPARRVKGYFRQGSPSKRETNVSS